MPLNKQFVINALLQNNYFPSQRKDKDEIPPIFSSSSFSEEAAIDVEKTTAKDGHDCVIFKGTRFDGACRIYSIPHPAPYAGLCLEIAKNWNNLKLVCNSDSSMIIPRQHRDGRIIIMNYDHDTHKAIRHNRLSFGRSFLAKCDISNCYNSIYSHSIPWASVGITTTKNNKRIKKAWYNELDIAITKCKRLETNGLPIGPASSNIIAEYILQRVDTELSKSGYVFTRYIDDYSCYCNDDNEAQSFFIDLQKELFKFKLCLNTKKTQVLTYPFDIKDHWVSKIRSNMPKSEVISIAEIADFMNLAFQMNRESRGSILKYAINLVLNKYIMSAETTRYIKDLICNIAFHSSEVIPCLNNRKIMNVEVNDWRKRNEIMLTRYIEKNNDQAITWLLYYMYACGEKCDNEELAQDIIRNKGCLPIYMLYIIGSPSVKDRVVKFAGSLRPGYESDEYWLLLYRLFSDGVMNIPDRSFPILQKHGVKFDTV